MKQTLSQIKPELAAQWHPTKNGDLTPNDVTIGQNKKVWWVGPCGHEWEATVANRYHGTGCPVCNGKTIVAGINDLATVNPQLTAQWHPTKNEQLTPNMVTARQNKKVWWLCPKCGHEWPANIAQRNNGSDCPICSKENRHKAIPKLSETNPMLAAQWHPTKNKALTPNETPPGSNQKVWWLCPNCGNEWSAIINSRNRGSGCPVCARKNRKPSRKHKK